MLATLATYVIIIIVIAALVAILLAVCRHMGVAVPPLVVQIAWIVFGAAIAVIGVKLILALL